MKVRKVVPVDPQLDNQLGRYVAAAKADANPNYDLFATAVICTLGFGSLAITPFASAEIVYTPTDKVVGQNLGFSALPIDLNNDGMVDLNLSAYNFVSFSSGAHFFHSLNAVAEPGNMILATSHSPEFAAADAQGQVIGAGVRPAHFGRDAIMAKSTVESDGGHSFFSSRAGQWLNSKNRYLGIKFSIGGEVHYGWARISANPGTATLTGYAYETTPNKPILAGATEDSPVSPVEGVGRRKGKRRFATLGGLARGANATVEQPNQ
jgi:hypothetical protein